MPTQTIWSTGGISTDSNSDLNAATKLYVSKTSLTGQVFDVALFNVGQAFQIKSTRNVSRYKEFILLDSTDQGDHFEFDVANTKIGPMTTLEDEPFSISINPEIRGTTELWSLTAPTEATPGTPAPLNLQFTPLTTGQTAELFTVAGNILTSVFSIACRVDIGAEVDLTIAANNNEVQARITETASVAAGGVGRLSFGQSSPRATIIETTGANFGALAFNIGDTISWTFEELYADGTSIATAQSFSVLISDVVLLDAA